MWLKREQKKETSDFFSSRFYISTFHHIITSTRFCSVATLKNKIKTKNYRGRGRTKMPQFTLESNKLIRWRCINSFLAFSGNSFKKIMIFVRRAIILGDSNSKVNLIVLRNGWLKHSCTDWIALLFEALENVVRSWRAPNFCISFNIYQRESQRKRDGERRAEANPYGFHEMQLSLVEQCLPISFKPKSTI